MRNLVLLAVASTLGACTSTFNEPRLLVSPYLASYRLHGDVALQSQPTPGTVQDNPAQPTRAFGLDRYDTDFGVRADFGDGFAGLRLDYYRLDHETSKSSVLDGDWGNLTTGDDVRMRASMDEFRLGWLEPLFTARTSYREQPLKVQMAAGGVLAHRDLGLRATTTDGIRTQNVDLGGDVAYAAMRLRATWRTVGVELDYAISPGLVLGGDFEDVQHDLEVRGTYNVPLYDVTFFAGYRWSQLHAEGDAGALGYDADLVVDGFQFGASLLF